MIDFYNLITRLFKIGRSFFMFLYLDSNIIYMDPFFSKPDTLILLDTLEKNGGKIFISDIVLQESKNNLSKKLNELKENIESKAQDFFKHANVETHDFESTIFFDVESSIERFEKRINELAEQHLLEIIDHNDVDAKFFLDDIIYRSLNNIKPFKDKKEEFKDTVIWKTYVEHVKKQSGSNFFFISNNKSDFYKESPQKGDSNQKVYLHEDLLKDTNLFQPFLTVQSFVHSSQFEEISSRFSDDIVMGVEYIPDPEQPLKEALAKFQDDPVYLNNYLLSKVGEQRILREVKKNIRFQLSQEDVSDIAFDFPPLLNLTDIKIDHFEARPPVGVIRDSKLLISSYCKLSMFTPNILYLTTDNNPVRLPPRRYDLTCDFSMIVSEDILPVGFDIMNVRIMNRHDFHIE